MGSSMAMTTTGLRGHLRRGVEEEGIGHQASGIGGKEVAELRSERQKTPSQTVGLLMMALGMGLPRHARQRHRRSANDARGLGEA